MSGVHEDERLETAIRDELAWDFLIDESQLEVEVDDRVVTLVGTVESYAQKMVALAAVQRVAGVHDVLNAIDVKPIDTGPSDEELGAMVRQILTWDALVPEQHLQVQVVDGMVALTGRCATRAQALEAERAVGHLVGVRDVLNRIEVAKPSPSTVDVRRAIAEALGRRAKHQAAGIDVIVDGASVTLVGTVQSPLERRAVVAAVTHAPGIADVRDGLVIAEDDPPGR